MRRRERPTPRAGAIRSLDRRCLGRRARLLAALAALVGCRAEPPAPSAAPAGGQPEAPRLVDATRASGITFVHFNDATAERLLPETMGAGLAVFDYDGDGDADLYFADGGPLARSRAGAPGGVSPGGALYRNRGDGTFDDVTAGAGLGAAFYAMGAAVGDVDGDGALDLFVSGVGGDRLLRNRGDGSFADVTAEAGLVDRGFGSSAAFIDYDRDGRVDLFAGRYVRWTAASDIPCRPDGVERVYCTPEVYPGESNRLYRNLGGLRFADVTSRSGVELADGKTLGVVTLDADRDGWPDIAVANDTVRNFLFLNQGDGRFREEGVAAGIAYSPSGSTRGGMGVDAGWLDEDPYLDVVIGNFALEMTALYRGGPGGLFIDRAAEAGIGLPTLEELTFGTLITDLDGDGRPDLVLANGHIEPEIARIRPPQAHAQPLQVFLNQGGGSFAELADRPGSALEQPLVGRGLVDGDLDGDGDLDLAVSQNGGPARLIRNDFPPRAWVRLALVGRNGDPAPYGAEVEARSGERSWRRALSSGRSYLSASEPIVTVGLGAVESLDQLEITWPSGRRQRLLRPPLGKLLKVTEPDG